MTWFKLRCNHGPLLPNFDSLNILFDFFYKKYFVCLNAFKNFIFFVEKILGIYVGQSICIKL